MPLLMKVFWPFKDGMISVFCGCGLHGGQSLPALGSVMATAVIDVAGDATGKIFYVSVPRKRRR